MSALIRRGLDLVGAGVGLVVLSPLLLAGAALARWHSPGPALFRHRRVGLNGREFMMLKLRTMVAGADLGAALTAKGDARITPIGRFLRRIKLDELPQLVNVLRGEMSLVGPRPETPAVVARYTPEQRLVLSVRPGITGPSQIRFRHEEESYPAGVDTEAYYMEAILPPKLATDLEYIRTRTILRDLGYLWETVLALVRRAPRADAPCAGDRLAEPRGR